MWNNKILKAARKLRAGFAEIQWMNKYEELNVSETAQANRFGRIIYTSMKGTIGGMGKESITFQRILYIYMYVCMHKILTH